MSTQITVRLADETVEYIDHLVHDGAPSRASVVERAVRSYQRKRQADHDAELLAQQGDYDEFDDLPAHSAIEG